MRWSEICVYVVLRPHLRLGTRGAYCKNAMDGKAEFVCMTHQLSLRYGLCRLGSVILHVMALGAYVVCQKPGIVPDAPDEGRAPS